MAFWKGPSQTLKFMSHVFPDIQPNDCALGLGDFCEITDHVNQDFFAAGLKIQRCKPAKVLVDR